MEDFYNTTMTQNSSHSERDPKIEYVLYVAVWIIVSVGLPLIILAISSLFLLVRNDHVAPIYVINLLISDLVQLCCIIIGVVQPNGILADYSSLIHRVGMMANIGFMMCIAVERYLVIAWPLWYRFKRSIKTSVLVCVIVWLLSLVPLILGLLSSYNKNTIFAIFFLLPFPVLIFSLAGTLKSLSGAISVSSGEKRRIVVTLVLVLFIYTLLFLPIIIYFITFMQTNTFDAALLFVTRIFIRISPLADLVLYIFMSKGATEKLLAFLCHCRRNMQQNKQQVVMMHGGSMYTSDSM